MRYRDKTRNMREIGQALRVAYLLEGSVRRSHDKIRVTAQLIDAGTDEHVWAEHYDRDLADVFGVQSEVAENIVTQLKANLSPSEKAAINVRPTHDLEAFDLYLQAKELISTFQDTPDWKETLLKAADYSMKPFHETRILPWLIAGSGANEALYWYELDHTPAVSPGLARQHKSVGSCARLRRSASGPGDGLYHGMRDYARAREELAIARRFLPNNAEIFSSLGGSIGVRVME
jgi:hypothetical protein